ncbi:MAG TPA: exodeoxyribonuclease VII large subunit [Gemmatimonadaceae bacterium]|nr:exodeoxyribonuclease VII large subunit [Gemmatimonadaceae bacterium]
MPRGREPRGSGAGGFDLFEAPADAAGMIAPDAAPGERAETAIPVALLTQTAKAVIDGAFSPLWVRGEVSDFKAHRNGHWYFSLRDASAQIRCVVWARDQRGIPAAPDDGMLVSALGQLTVYAARGEMQFGIRRLEAAGDGLWRKAFEQTRARLEADGLLAPERKRPIPRYPRRIAVITSPTGAALHDITAVIRRRAPGVEVVVIPAAVQGETAPAELCAALDRLARWGDADLLIIGRGGGAREDLWAFNDEAVARALAACPLPTISAVGHEVDVTICDLVADLRAPTPSAAAEAAVRAVSELATEVRLLGARLRRAVGSRLDVSALRLQRAGRAMHGRASRAVERRRARMQALAGRLDALSPLATLERGYAVARDPSGRVLSSAAQFTPGSTFDLTLRDGRVGARAIDIQERA